MVSLAHLDVLPPPASRGGGVGSKAKLGLVSALLAEEEARPCAVVALRWLVRHAGVERAVCAVADSESGRLIGLTGIGVPPSSVDSFSLDLGDRAHPLVVALSGGEPVVFHDSSQPLLRALETPLGNLSFHAVPLGTSKEEIGPGLLLLTGIEDGPVSDDILWVAELLGVRLASLWYRRAQTEERRHKRERSWLFSTINAVTDPILLTDADGRILVANAGAEMLLTAGEDKREGWRRAVALNNMLFSASLFTNAAESGPTRRELLLVDPSEGRGPAVRGAEHAGADPPRRDRAGLGAAQRHRPAPGDRGDRGELPPPAGRRGRDPRRARPPRPDPQLGARPHPGHRRGGQHRRA